MRELVPGLFHWTTFHDGIGLAVSSYYVEPAAALIDPRVPDDEGLEAFADLARPQQIVLTTGLHARHATRFADAFGCVIRASPQALERVSGGLEGDLYTDGEEVAPGVTAIHIDAIAPDEYALHIAVDDGAIAFADALQTYGGEPVSRWRARPPPRPVPRAAARDPRRARSSARRWALPA